MKNFIAVLLVSFSLAACSSPAAKADEAPIVGLWKDGGNISYQFSADHSGVCTSYGRPMSFTWAKQPDGTIRIENSSGFITVELKDGQMVFGSKVFVKAQ